MRIIEKNIIKKQLIKNLLTKNIDFEEQVYLPLEYKGDDIGRYFLDFLIEKKIILELKRDSIFRKQNIDQVLAYLKASNLKLGIIANFTRDGVKFYRVLNIR